jgi:RNA recognition motif-containing protein
LGLKGLAVVAVDFEFSFLLFMISDARVMWDNKTGRSRGYGFVSFRNQQA